MKETGLLMTPENAQKCFDGTKTQTRRLNGLNHINESPDYWAVMAHDPAGLYWSFVHRTKSVKHGGGIVEIKCPYGVPGDRLWVREPSHICNGAQRWKDGTVLYRGEHGVTIGGTYVDLAKWTPSIHMKRIYCRSVLELTDIRVQRLQEISEEDAKAEGCQRWEYKNPVTDEDDFGMARDGFIDLWLSINGPGSWAANPWVWCLSFKKVRP